MYQINHMRLVTPTYKAFASMTTIGNFGSNIISRVYDREIIKKAKPVMDAIDVLNDAGFRTGEVLPRSEIHRLGKLHRAVHLYLFDMKGNLLLQRRPSDVDHYPNMLSISLTGHVNAEEFSQQALEREIKEELGLDTSKLEPKFLFSFRQEAKLGPYWDRQFNDVYFCQHDFSLKDIPLDPKEVSELKLVPFNAFRNMVLSRDPDLAPVYEDSAHEVAYFLPQLLGEVSKPC